MPAKSEKQRRLFGMALSVKRGEMDMSEIRDEEIKDSIKGIVDDISEEEIEDYASEVEKD